MSASVLRRRIAVGTGIVIGIVITPVTLAGCSSSGSGRSAGNTHDSTHSITVSGGTSQPATTTPSTTPSTTMSTTTAACGGKALTAARAAVHGFPQVTDVLVDGGCHQLAIATSMAAADPLTPDSAKAMDICRAAAKVGYLDGVSSVTVSWSDGHEAPAGLQGQDCIPG